MSATQSGIKGAIPVGTGTPSALGFGVLPIGPDGQVLTADSTQPEGVKWVSPSAAAVDPRDIMRFSMIHNVGVVGGG